MKKVWILYYNNQDESYENTRLVQAFADQNIEARVLRPKLFDIVVSRNSEKSILYEGKRVSLPDLVLTRTGAGSNYFTLAVMRQFEKFGVPVINDADSILKVIPDMAVQKRAEEPLKVVEIQKEADSPIREVSAKEVKSQSPIIKEETVGRNDPCPCGSGKKYKKCHGA